MLATEIVRLLNWEGMLPEVIVVGIGYPTSDADIALDLRLRDMMPKAGPGARPDACLGFIREELIPHVEANYIADPGDRTIVGASAGGHFALYALFQASATFHRYCASSPAGVRP